MYLLKGGGGGGRQRLPPPAAARWPRRPPCQVAAANISRRRDMLYGTRAVRIVLRHIHTYVQAVQRAASDGVAKCSNTIQLLRVQSVEPESFYRYEQKFPDYIRNAD